MIVPGRHHTPKNQISLLQCLLEQCQVPQHLVTLCGSNKCPRCVYDAYKAELEATYVPTAGSIAPVFPMLDEPRKIPWDLGEAIYDTLYHPIYSDQKLHRLAERGGFGWDEVKLMAREWARKKL